MADSAAVYSADPPLKRRVPNPLGNPHLNLSPRCGARTRAGGPCQAPALRGRLRCRMHGGGSTGPRTEAGMARMRAARTVHGGYSAARRALDRHILTMARRTRLLTELAHWLDYLPPALAARLTEARELRPPACPAGGITPQQDKALLQSEREAQAPWRQALAEARDLARARRARNGEGPHAPVGMGACGEAAVAGATGPHVPVSLSRAIAAGLVVAPTEGTRARSAASGVSLASAVTAAPAERQTEPHAPVRIDAVDPRVVAQQEGPHAPVGGIAAEGAYGRLSENPIWAAFHNGLLGDDDALAPAVAARQAEAHVPVTVNRNVPASHVRQVEAHAPVGNGRLGPSVRAEQGKVHAPVASGAAAAGGLVASRLSSSHGDGSEKEPHALVGLTRKQRRHLKWLRRRAAKGR